MNTKNLSLFDMAGIVGASVGAACLIVGLSQAVNTPGYFDTKTTFTQPVDSFSLGAYAMAAGVEPTANPYSDEKKAEQWLMGWISEANGKRNAK